MFSRSGGRASRASPAPQKHSQHSHNTHNHSQTEYSDMWCADGRSPTRPSSKRRGSGRADGRRTITRHQRTRTTRRHARHCETTRCRAP
eukprot:4728810-Prymnesium_polylepis.1